MTREQIESLCRSLASEQGSEAIQQRIFEMRDLALRGRAGDRWIPVSEKLPDDEPLHGIPYMEYIAKPVLVIHRDRPDYPITAHTVFSDDPAAMGVAIVTNGASKFKFICWYSIGRDLSNPFDMASSVDGPFKDSAGYQRFLPKYFGRGITHWMPLPPEPEEKP